MPQPAGPPGLSRRPDVPINVPDVFAELHHRYGQIVAQLLQENAELVTALNNLSRQLADAQAHIAALKAVIEPPADEQT